MTQFSFDFHQVHIQYLPEEDRIVIKINSKKNEQFSIAFTRRFTRVFWPVLLDVLVSDPAFAAYDPTTKHVAAEFKHEKIMASADTQKPFQQENVSYPWGETPQLMAKAIVKKPTQGEGLMSIGLYANNNLGFEFPANHPFLHYLYKGFLDLEKATDWNLQLQDLNDRSLAGLETSGKKLN